MAARASSRHPDGWREVQRLEIGDSGVAITVTLWRAPDPEAPTGHTIVATLQGINCRLEGEMPGEYWLIPDEPRYRSREGLQPDTPEEGTP